MSDDVVSDLRNLIADPRQMIEAHVDALGCHYGEMWPGARHGVLESSISPQYARAHARRGVLFREN